MDFRVDRYIQQPYFLLRVPSNMLKHMVVDLRKYAGKPF